ncbi:hypothetical protein GCM10018785_12030 [Streptomyces longispororuber]|uniref:Uncharacterized protein n=1 Tax=Streptomyces longispororuber TaxID=68230 RepID=A0A919DFU8_9ACTN|nr:hypothetical protein GCM10018785_12030 [Streptomyces longispororuber]
MPGAHAHAGASTFTPAQPPHRKTPRRTDFEVRTKFQIKEIVLEHNKRRVEPDQSVRWRTRTDAQPFLAPTK